MWVTREKTVHFWEVKGKLPPNIFDALLFGFGHCVPVFNRQFARTIPRKNLGLGREEFGIDHLDNQDSPYLFHSVSKGVGLVFAKTLGLAKSCTIFYACPRRPENGFLCEAPGLHHLRGDHRGATHPNFESLARKID